jgi:hypothetical protein
MIMFSVKTKFVALIFSVLFLLISRYVIDHSAEALPQVLPLVAHASLLIAGGLITLSFGSLLRTFVDVENWAASSLFREVLQEQASDFFIGFIIVAYLSLIRPPLAAHVTFIPYVEWIAIALVVYVMYTTTRQPADEIYISSQAPDWKRHVQEIRRETGRDLTRVTSVMEQFVDHGVKEPLLVYLTLHLQMLGDTEEEILKTLNSLIDYRENAQRYQSHFLAFPGTKRKLAMRNKEARENLLDALLKKVDKVQLE